MAMNKVSEQHKIVQLRFERDAAAFDSIYGTQHEFAGWFNRLFRKPIFERYDITFEEMGNLDGKSVLDVGCGSGIYSMQCALKDANHVKGIDFSAPMLAIAKERAKQHQLDAKCSFELIDFMHMNDIETFDFAIVMGVFDYLAEPLPFLKKLKRMTRGKVIVSFPGHSLIREPLRKLRYLFTSKGKVFFYTKADIERLARETQFSTVEIRPMQTGSGFVLIARV